MSEDAEMHLTEEALLRLQMGDATEAERAHLAGCPQCRAKAEPLSDALRWFGAAAREFGAETAATPRYAKAAAHAWPGWSRALGAACCVLLIVLGMAIPRWQHRRATAAAALAQQQRQQQLTEDDVLLEEVDQDVSQVVPEAMQPLSWNSSTSAATSNTSARQ